jgi:hypothetical protein
MQWANPVSSSKFESGHSYNIFYSLNVDVYSLNVDVYRRRGEIVLVLCAFKSLFRLLPDYKFIDEGKAVVA